MVAEPTGTDYSGESPGSIDKSELEAIMANLTALAT